ncbi:MAG: hypothetical protein AAFR89_06470 [Cyanobacteria bacterium J06633_1]
MSVVIVGQQDFALVLENLNDFIGNFFPTLENSHTLITPPLFAL